MSPRSSGATFPISPPRKFHACSRRPGASHRRSCKCCPCTSARQRVLEGCCCTMPVLLFGQSLDFVIHTERGPTEADHCPVDAVAVGCPLVNPCVYVQRPKSSKNTRPQPAATGMSSGWGTYSWYLPAAQAFGLINAGAVHRRSDGSKRRACTEWHCVQMDHDPCLHHATTGEARVSVRVGKPSSLIAT